MNNLYPNTINWSAIIPAMGFAMGFLVTGLAIWLLPKLFPRLKRPEVSFWVMLCIFMVTSISSMLTLAPLQAQHRQQAALTSQR